MKNLLPLLLVLLVSCKKLSVQLPGSKVSISNMTLHTSLTLINNTNASVDLSNWKLKEEVDYIITSTSTYLIIGKTLGKGSSVTFSASELGFKLDILHTKIYLYDNLDNLIDER